ncbi:MAG TPA: rhamnan synthesis F family protein [Polyangiales bacterium]|nr:rhamnan synthesis F family protein [Polyangiales bacterium]
MKRLAVLAHHEPHGHVHGYVLQHLRALRQVAGRVVLVSSSPLTAAARAEAAAVCDRVLLRANVGYDFAAWRDALAGESLDLDALILTNDSVLGPFADYAQLFARMHEADFWGATDSHEYTWHVQSYFLVTSRRVLASEAFRRFWAGVLDYRDKVQVVRSYELGWSSYLVDQGFRGAAVVPFETVAGHLEREARFPWSRPKHLERRSLLVCYPEELIRLGAPFVKRRSLIELKQHGTLGQLRALAEQVGYPQACIDEALEMPV